MIRGSILKRDYFEMSITKNRLKRGFTIVPNKLITADISDGALRLMLYLLSKPDNWQIWNNDIMKQLSIGSEKTLSKRWKELIYTNWISREKATNESGQFTGGYDYTLNESPEPALSTDSDKKEGNTEPALFTDMESLQNRQKYRHSKTNSFNKTETNSKTKEQAPIKKSKNKKPSAIQSLKNHAIKKHNLSPEFIDKIFEHRKGIGKAITGKQPKVLDNIILGMVKAVELNKFKHIDNALAYYLGTSWQGFNPDWVKHQSSDDGSIESFEKRVNERIERLTGCLNIDQTIDLIPRS